MTHPSRQVGEQYIGQFYWGGYCYWHTVVRGFSYAPKYFKSREAAKPAAARVVPKAVADYLALINDEG